MDLIGYLGGTLLSLCALPLAWEAFKTKKANINLTFLNLWFAGEVLTLIYVVYTEPLLPLIANYIFNILCILIVYYYKWRGKK